MRQSFTEKLWQLILDDCSAYDQAVIWKKPIIRFADADDPYFPFLRELIRSDHHLPQDFLPGAKTVVSWFLPFIPEIGQSNRNGELCSDAWANAYLVTNAMAARVNVKLTDYIRDTWDADSAVPRDAGMLGRDVPWSLWSQRHVAYLAGHGTFGMNNMLISDEGCVGRYFSIVTELEIKPDATVTDQRCLYKIDGSCGLCITRCPAGALTQDGFDRYCCMAHCQRNEKDHPGAQVCGKCLVELPCSYRNPVNLYKE